MENSLQIAIVQYDIKWHDIKVNLKQLDDLFKGISGKTDLILLPEMFATGFTIQPELFMRKDAETIRKWMISVSDNFQSIVIGSISEKVGKNYYNRLYCCKPGKKPEYYDKRHLFAMGDESKHYSSGSKQLIVNFSQWNIMPLICYDLRFPVWSRNINSRYDILVYIANWPAVRNSIWETLLKARAIENQCYVLGVNRIGKDGRDIEYIGNSMIISPKGETLNMLAAEEGILFAELDYHLLQRFRSNFPVLNDADDFDIK